MSGGCLEAAIAYARRGLPVFPVRGKVPATEHGFKDATTDETIIRRWWSHWPDAGIGVPLGPSIGLVLDVDPRHGGEDSLRCLVETYGPLPDGPVARTGGGGSHYWFAWPGGKVPIAHGFRPGLDLQSTGSYVVLPPSRHPSGRDYSWERPLIGASLPLPPVWLLTVVGERHGPRQVRRFDTKSPGRVSAGQRHDFLVSVAASIASRVEIGEPQLVEILRAVAPVVMETDSRTDVDIREAARSALAKFGPVRPTLDPDLATWVYQNTRGR